MIQIIVPFGGDNPLRVAALWRVMEHLAPLCWPISIARDDGNPHSRARCCNQGAAEATADVLVFNDADIICPHSQIEGAIERAAWAPGLVFAFRTYVRLNENGSRGIVAHEPPSNGCIAISRACFEEVGGYNEDYVGWSLEDRDFNDRCAALWPIRRVDGEAEHLWHGERRQDVPDDCDFTLAQQNRARYESSKQ